MWPSMNTNAGAPDVEWWADVAKAIGRMGAVISQCWMDWKKQTHLYRQSVRLGIP